MRLFELLKLSGIELKTDEIEDREISQVTHDSRQSHARSVFVAIRGSQLNGNAFIPQAHARGAFVITEESVPAQSGFSTLKVSSVRKVYALLQSGMHGHPSQKLKTIGVTGTNGKTTTAFLLHHFLNSHGEAGMMGTVSTRFKGTEIPSTHTTPDPGTIHSLLQDMVQAGCRYVVMEASSHALDQDRLSGIRFDAAIFTNLTRDHMDYHKDSTEYFEAKAKLFGQVRQTGRSILNADDPWFGVLKPRAGRCLTYAMDAKADLVAAHSVIGLGGSQFTIVYRDKEFKIKTALIGRHNIYNILAATAAAVSLGLSVDACADALKSFGGVPGRLERVDGGQDFHLFIDYAHTDDGLKNVLQALKPLVSKRLLVLFGCGGERDRGKRPAMAGIAESFADATVLTSDNPRGEDENEILKEIQAGFTSGFKDYEIQKDRRKAIRRILMMATPGDVVLIAGKGHETVQIIGTQKIPFNDHEEALRVLRGR